MSPYVQAAAVGLLGLVVLLFLRSRKDERLPPGPRGLPLLGSLLSTPTHSHWLWFDKLHARYGPIVTVQVAHKRLVLCGDWATAHELLDVKSNSNVLRPTNWLLVRLRSVRLS
jgi:hypothetical protein